jgi:hypothetical protein
VHRLLIRFRAVDSMLRRRRAMFRRVEVLLPRGPLLLAEAEAVRRTVAAVVVVVRRITESLGFFQLGLETKIRSEACRLARRLTPDFCFWRLFVFGN